MYYTLLGGGGGGGGKDFFYGTYDGFSKIIPLILFKNMTYAYAHAPSREDTRIVKGEKGEYRGERGGEGECRGERETGKGKMEECRL